METNNNVEAIEEVKQYIVVCVGVEQYGVDIGFVDNIVRMQKITRVPKSIAYFNGVINLRGEIIPIISLRRRFDLEVDTFTDKTRIIILRTTRQDAIGIIVDEVKEVINLRDEDVDKLSTDTDVEGERHQTRYILGVGKNKANNTLVSLLNIGNVIGDEQV